MAFRAFNHETRRLLLREWGNGGDSREHTMLPSTRIVGDRFIPVRAAMDMDVSSYLLRSKNRNSEMVVSPSKEEYRKRLANIVLKDHNTSENHTRILQFHAKPCKRKQSSALADDEELLQIPKKPRKLLRHIPQTAERTLDAPDIVNDYYLNLLDWSTTNVVAIGLGNTVYLWNASNSAINELTQVHEDDGPITSVAWAQDGNHIAVGLNNSEVQIWDHSTMKKVRSMRGHSARVGSLAWHGSTLCTGGRDSKILYHDVRNRNHITSQLSAHEQEVCGLKWSLCGKQLASGGNDNFLYIWDARSITSSRHLFRFDQHKAAVKALAWCPYQTNLLASGGGTTDRCIKFWNTQRGMLLNSIDTGSQVCSLQWNHHEQEILSSHGFSENQLILWKYPSMRKITEIMGHTSRVLHMAQSPDGFTVATAAADETLRFWQVFGPAVSTTTPRKGKEKETGFSSFNHAYIR
ncbi:hypothetical protein AMTRI_Chr09g14710 [Amborella trichopoda]